MTTGNWPFDLLPVPTRPALDSMRNRLAAVLRGGTAEFFLKASSEAIGATKAQLLRYLFEVALTAKK